MTSFAVTWDYRCPFARNAHDHLLTALEGGADYDVRFVPFNLNVPHADPEGPPVWEDPAQAPSMVAMEAGIVVRDRFPEQFLAVHRGLFALKHDQGGDLRDWDQIARVLAAAGVDADTVRQEIEDGWPRKAFQQEHEAAVAEQDVWGVPTFLADGQAVFVRLMDRPAGDAAHARRTIDRVLDLVTGWPELNEFKHTSLPR